jgi:hypothetical protein
LPELRNPFRENEKTQNIEIAIKNTIFSCVQDTFLNRPNMISSNRYSQTPKRDCAGGAHFFLVKPSRADDVTLPP